MFGTLQEDLEVFLGSRSQSGTSPAKAQKVFVQTGSSIHLKHTVSLSSCESKRHKVARGSFWHNEANKEGIAFGLPFNRQTTKPFSRQ